MRCPTCGEALIKTWEPMAYWDTPSWTCPTLHPTPRRSRNPWRRAFVALLVLVVLFVVVPFGTLAWADSHEAAAVAATEDTDQGIPGPVDDAVAQGLEGIGNTIQNDCPPEPPRIQEPGTGLAGGWMAPPSEYPPPKITPDGWFAERGFGGARTFTYDQGCIRTPVDAAKQVQANLENETANGFAGIGFAFTAMAHDLDTRSWDVEWLFDIMAIFAGEALAGIEAGFVLPFIAAGLLFTTLVLLVRARNGESGPVLLSVVWSLAVLAIGAAVINSPLLAPRLAAQTTAGITSTVYGEEGNPAEIITNRTMEQVHYRGLMRRYFGDQVADVAKTNLPEIIEASSWSWEESARIQADPAAEEELRRDKLLQLDSAMGMIEEHAPGDYEDLGGQMRPRTDAAALEAAHAAGAGLFRIMSAGVRILGLISLGILAVLWLAAMPVLVTPQGEQVGRSLLAGTLRTVWLMLKSVFGTFGFGIFAYAAMAPEVPMGTSLVLLVLLTIIFWALVRPDRAMMSMMSFGKVQSSGRRGRLVSRTMQRRMMRKYLLAGAAGGALARRRSAPQAPAPAAAPQTWTGGVTPPTAPGAPAWSTRPTAPPPAASPTWRSTATGQPVPAPGQPGGWRGPTRATNPVITAPTYSRPVDDDTSGWTPPEPPEPGTVYEHDVEAPTYTRPVDVES